jgi:hypothetical protein
VEAEMLPSIWIYKNELPWVDFEENLSKCPSFNDNMKYVKRNVIGQIEGRLKSKYNLGDDSFSFITIINVKAPEDIKTLLGKLEVCFQAMFKELQMLGWKSTNE